ncbi:leucine-rich repeat-containing protein 15-like [Schistocerca piceifrons]|uniref:leucine-rich repeat-containing protein 15-like n=1 Tax=Schistocerca piceifrons TaxID=274613 RepID=UPI001F5EC158|nr:leucine-rich repeat-containing protein 15-like [Schistocerca piceifrons]
MLRSLPRDLFCDTRELKLLLVQKNLKLRSLDRDVFRDGSRLEDVILDHNNISSVERDVFTHLTNVKRLNLAYNKIRILPEGIFRDNRELQELRLSGNPVHINARVASELISELHESAEKQRQTASASDAQVQPTEPPDWPSRKCIESGMAGPVTQQDLQIPAEFIQNCTKLACLGLAYNELKVLSSDLVFLHGGSLATLTLEGNPWHCDCDILPLASWASLRKDAVPEWPNCSSPHGVKKEPLQHWFHSKNETKCGDATLLLRADLNRVLSVARAIAERGPNFSTDLLPVSDKEISFTATNYFLYAIAAMTDADIDGVVWHWARFLEKVLNRRHLHYTEAVAEKSLNRTRIEPLTTTTTKPPAARAVKQRLRLKGFQPLMNFTYEECHSHSAKGCLPVSNCNR